ncbi:MAG TPA: group II intron reverse transcriptase/maturase [Ktedonobacteraceae bacterium]|nr:group II intron reverse transcriptase/maturase [Ktedonobacteraceae bacterium]
MTTETTEATAPDPSVGATTDRFVAWHQINWRKAERTVRRLQTRIAQATQAGKWGKVKALQRLLTHSFSGKALAVRRVTENTGKRTPGVDGVIWNTPEQKTEAVQSLTQRGYHPLPLRRIDIPKSNGGRRPLSIPTMRDRTMQALYLLALDPVSETTADPNSYGFRRGRSTADAIEACFIALCRKDRAQWILEGDIRSCFDRISHEWLLTHIPMDKTMLRKWLQAGYRENHHLYPTEEGTPQGGICSPVIANRTLDGLERLLAVHFPKTGKEAKRSKVNLIRYADDFCITGASKELLEQEVKPLVEQFLSERGLQLSSEKTVITHIEQGFDFLGQTVRKYQKGKEVKFFITPSKKNVKAFLAKIRNHIKKSRDLSAGELIAELNPQIRGWALYHRHAVSKDVFHTVDHEIFKALWVWAQRRHRHKTRWWIKDKYWLSTGPNRWVFTGFLKGKEGQMKMVHLLSADSIRIQRHTKIRAEANPYDPSWEPYFEKRLDVQMFAVLKGRRWLQHLWKEQAGLCPICQQKITKITGWHSHHILWRSKGGSDGAENRVLLHPNCHHQVHSQGLHVEKPRPVKRAERKA